MKHELPPINEDSKKGDAKSWSEKFKEKKESEEASKNKSWNLFKRKKKETPEKTKEEKPKKEPLFTRKKKEPVVKKEKKKHSWFKKNIKDQLVKEEAPQKKEEKPLVSEEPAKEETPVKEKKPETKELVPKKERKSWKERFTKKKKDKPKSEQEKADEVAEKIQKTPIKKKKKARKKLQRRSLEQYLEKAGFEIPAEKVRRGLFYGVLAVFLLGTIIVLYLGGMNGAETWDTLLFVLGMWTFVFAGVLLLSHMLLYFFLDYRIYNRTKELEDVLPDFLQLASANIAAGMPIDKALWYSIRPNFGVLAKEMEQVAKATMAGEDLEQSLINLTKRHESVVLKRSVSILVEGLHAGGEMADLLAKIALNNDELKIMKKEMAANVTTYAIFITFASIIISPFLFALATQLLEIIIGITSTLDGGGGSMLSLNAADPGVVGDFKLFSIFMLLVSTIFSASIVSAIRKGNVVDGIKTIPVYATVAIIVYFIGIAVLGSLFSGLL